MREPDLNGGIASAIGRTPLVRLSRLFEGRRSRSMPSSKG